MGLFYTTFTLHGPDNGEILAALKNMRRTAFVSPTVDRFTSVYDRQTEEQDFGEIESFGSILSEQTAAPILGMPFTTTMFSTFGYFSMVSVATSITHCLNTLTRMLSQGRRKAVTLKHYAKHLSVQAMCRESSLFSALTCSTTNDRISPENLSTIRR